MTTIPTARDLWNSDYYAARSRGLPKEEAASEADDKEKIRQHLGDEGLRKAEAARNRLADLDTLDTWSAEKPAREVWQDRFGFSDDAERDFVISLSDENGTEHEFDGPSFQGARAKAAAWLRETGQAR